MPRIPTNWILDNAQAEFRPYRPAQVGDLDQAVHRTCTSLTLRIAGMLVVQTIVLFLMVKFL
jgi:hypothetical protein